MSSGENRDIKPYKEIKLFALALDPVYIGTGGYTIGRVDNTVVRDKATNVPKIPGSSLAGTWRYYVALNLINFLQEKLDKKWESLKNKLKGKFEDKAELLDNIDKRELNLSSFVGLFHSLVKKLSLECDEDKKKLREILIETFEKIFQENTEKPDWKTFEGNKFARIKCAGQDDEPQKNLEELENLETGHCGKCIVCKGFGFAKAQLSWQGQIFFSDLEILLFPVFTYKGTKWITTLSRLKNAGLLNTDNEEPKGEVWIVKTEGDSSSEGENINLGWLYLKALKKELTLNTELLQFNHLNINPNDIVIVPEEYFAHIVNSNLEVKTSVSIDPITGAAKDGALFTTEAIPRGTVFYGTVRIFGRKNFEELLVEKIKPLPTIDMLKNALKDSKDYYELLGIGGMTTRGFGRIEIISREWNNGS